ncbi:dATP/dGTP diphosphohydrolase domain-containing protein [Dactylosporangium sp. CA-139066]|uniref:dATP/dGTP diphosphohydrolase domain-containing protein n=1 Tax=Dactylosporangium sp. CA-139066 TaxID=3239930 RepID=UPI003D8B81D0
MTDFETKDSGERAQFASGMVRDTEKGKPRFDLLMPKGVPFREQMLTRFAALMARGAEKYAARNWEQADSEAELERMLSSAFRHFMQWMAGETDEDHAAAVMFNLMAAETLRWKLRRVISD